MRNGTPLPNSPKSSGSSADEHFVVRGVAQRYNGTAALSNVDLTLHCGEAAALVGPSGAGKTTLLRVLNGAIRPTEGSVHLHGRNLADVASLELRTARAEIGFVHQNLSLIPNLRVSQNVIAGKLGRLGFWGSLRAMCMPSSADLERAHEILERVGIPEKLFERTDTLSGGQQQRVAIARALFQDPHALLADEPVSAVDPARAEDTVALLVDVARERKATLVMSLHNLKLARRYFPRLIGMRAGRIAFDRPAAEVDEASFERLYELDA